MPSPFSKIKTQLPPSSNLIIMWYLVGLCIFTDLLPPRNLVPLVRVYSFKLDQFQTKILYGILSFFFICRRVFNKCSHFNNRTLLNSTDDYLNIHIEPPIVYLDFIPNSQIGKYAAIIYALGVSLTLNTSFPTLRNSFQWHDLLSSNLISNSCVYWPLKKRYNVVKQKKKHIE